MTTDPNDSREQTEARIVALLLGEASPFEQAALSDLLRQDATLAAFHDEMKHVLSLVQAASAKNETTHTPTPAPPKLKPEKMRALNALFNQDAPVTRHEVVIPFWRKPWFIPASIAAGLVLLFAVGLSLPALSKAKSKSLAQLSRSNNTIANLRPEDGSRVWGLDGPPDQAAKNPMYKRYGLPLNEAAERLKENNAPASVASPDSEQKPRSIHDMSLAMRGRYGLPLNETAERLKQKAALGTVALPETKQEPDSGRGMSPALALRYGLMRSGPAAPSATPSPAGTRPADATPGIHLPAGGAAVAAGRTESIAEGRDLFEAKGATKAPDQLATINPQKAADQATKYFAKLKQEQEAQYAQEARKGQGSTSQKLVDVEAAWNPPIQGVIDDGESRLSDRTAPAGQPGPTARSVTAVGFTDAAIKPPATSPVVSDEKATLLADVANFGALSARVPQVKAEPPLRQPTFAAGNEVQKQVGQDRGDQLLTQTVRNNLEPLPLQLPVPAFAGMPIDTSAFGREAKSAEAAIPATTALARDQAAQSERYLRGPEVGQPVIESPVKDVAGIEFATTPIATAGAAAAKQQVLPYDDGALAQMPQGNLALPQGPAARPEGASQRSYGGFGAGLAKANGTSGGGVAGAPGTPAGGGGGFGGGGFGGGGRVGGDVRADTRIAGQERSLEGVPMLGDASTVGKAFKKKTEVIANRVLPAGTDVDEDRGAATGRLAGGYAVQPSAAEQRRGAIALPEQAKVGELTQNSTQNSWFFNTAPAAGKPLASLALVPARTELGDSYRESEEKLGRSINAPVALGFKPGQAVVPAEPKPSSPRPELPTSEVKLRTEMADKKTTSTDAPAKTPKTPAPIPQPEVDTRANAFSTFSLNVSDVSFRLAAASLDKGALPDASTIRSEEFVNAFDYRDPLPQDGARVAFAWERARYPFAHNRDLIRFAIRTAAQGREPGRPLNLVVLLDHSGSMERADRVAIIQAAMKVLAEQLQPQDRISLILFARTAQLWLDGLEGSKAQEFLARIRELNPQGGTNLEEALSLAYATAIRHFLANGNNRVILLTDGAANLGDVEPATLEQKVEAHRQKGIALDCFGIGWEGYNDDLLEVLARHGDGRYGFLNSVSAAKSDFANQLAGALQVAAADVKAQVEFNPNRVTLFRQIGYARHQLTKEQFRDNTVDAAEIGAAESGNALYVIQVNPQGQGPLGVVRVRFKVPSTGEYLEQAWNLPYAPQVAPLDQAAPSIRLAATAAAFSEWLANSPFGAEVDLGTLEHQLNGVPAVFAPDPRPQTLQTMIRQARSISGK